VPETLGGGVIPPLNAGANRLLDESERGRIWQQHMTLIVLNYVALSAAIVSSSVAPFVVAAAVAAGVGVNALVTDGGVPAVLRGVTWFLFGIPVWTYVWESTSVRSTRGRLRA